MIATKDNQMLLLLAASFAYLQLALSSIVEDKLLNSGGSFPSIIEDPLVKSFNPIELAIASNWTRFYFTNSGSFASTGLPLRTTAFVQLVASGSKCLQLTDLHCAGDQFALYNGVGTPTFVMNSTIPASVGCQYSSIDPNVTLQNPTWSSLQYDFIVPVPGPIAFYVVVTESPFYAGRGAIRILDTPCPVSAYG